MTRDERRDKCIVAMARSLAERADAPWELFIYDATYALDSLHGIARVCVATEETIREGDDEIFNQYQAHPKWEDAKDVAEGIDVFALYQAMTFNANLTNRPGDKE